MRHWKSNGSRLYHIPRVGRLAAQASGEQRPRYNPQLMSSTAPEMELAMALAGCPDVIALDRSLPVSCPGAP
jgi:hypothetical protein